MPDLLVISADFNLRSKVEEAARSRECRTKSAFDVQGALEWIHSWNFDVVCIDPSFGISDQEALADALWREHPIASFVIVDLSEDSSARLESKLFGAEVVRGPGALAALDKILEGIGPRTAMEIEDFKVMVVEDLDSARDIIGAYIESMGFGAVIGHRSAKDALAQLLADPECCSCIVTDIRMPELSGEYLIEQVRLHAKLQHLPIVVLTAYGSADALLGCLRRGASGFLVKPPKRKDLARELGRGYRIFKRQISPRLASPDEVDQLRVVLEQRGFI